MQVQELSTILDKHCRFMFRGGKEAFGVIWRSESKLLFSSNKSHFKLRGLRSLNPTDDVLEVDINDVLLAELIEG